MAFVALLQDTQLNNRRNEISGIFKGAKKFFQIKWEEIKKNANPKEP